MNKQPSFASEADLARVVVEWLSIEGWEVFQEVSCGGPRCDIVAKRGPVTWAIECKLTLNLDVISQAHYWRHRANFTSVAFPRARTIDCRVSAVLRAMGLGKLVATPPRDGSLGKHDLVESEMGPMSRPKLGDIRKYLFEEQKTICAAGGNRGGYFSPFKATCRSVREEVTREPGMTMRSLLAKIDHHYASDRSARACILQWVEKGIIEGVRVERAGKIITFHPEASR